MTIQQKRKKIEAQHGDTLIYIVEATTPERQWLKIGITTELLGCVTMIACGCPVPIEAAWYRDVGSQNLADWAEKATHLAFADAWSSGEWFEMKSDPALRDRIDAVIARFCKPAPWQCERFDASPWRRPENRAERLAKLVDLRAEGIERARKERRELPFKMEASAAELKSIYEGSKQPK